MEKLSQKKVIIGEAICALFTIICCVLGMVFTVAYTARNAPDREASATIAELYWILPLFVLLVLSVLTLASITLKKRTLIKAFLMIFLVSMALVFFVLTIAYSSNVASNTNPIWFHVSAFALSLLGLVVSILYFIYYLAYTKNGGSHILFTIANISEIVILIAFVGIVIGFVISGGYGTSNFPPLHYIIMPLALLGYGLTPNFIIYGENSSETSTVSSAKQKTDGKTTAKIKKSETIKVVLQEEIDSYYKARRLMLIVSLISFGFATLCWAGIPILSTIVLSYSGSMIAIGVLFLIAGVVLLILRSAIFNKKIQNRKDQLEKMK